jgi:hypothetical protein
MIDRFVEFQSEHSSGITRSFGRVSVVGPRNLEVGQKHTFLHGSVQQIADEARPRGQLVFLAASHAFLSAKKQTPPLNRRNGCGREKPKREFKDICKQPSAHDINGRV